MQTLFIIYDWTVEVSLHRGTKKELLFNRTIKRFNHSYAIALFCIGSCVFSISKFLLYLIYTFVL